MYDERLTGADSLEEHPYGTGRNNGRSLVRDHSVTITRYHQSVLDPFINSYTTFSDDSEQSEWGDDCW
jgi:hypothetical protein